MMLMVVALVGSIHIPRKCGKWWEWLSCKHKLLSQAAFCVDDHPLVFGHQPIRLDVISGVIYLCYLLVV